MPSLFDPLTLRGVTLRNRIGISPMSQYAAGPDGRAGDWHLVTLGARAAGGAGLVMVEATSVSPEARATPDDLGLWDDSQIAPLARVAGFIRDMGAVPGIQLQHAGAKASTTPPWHGGRPIGEQGWDIVGPTADPFGGFLKQAPRALDEAGIAKVRRDFADAARRADEAGFELLQLHAAHGYLLQAFLSPIANRRTDAYGQDRARLLHEVIGDVRDVWPSHKPLSIRLGAGDFHPDGMSVEDALAVARALPGAGVDLLDVSIAFSAVLPVDLPWDQPAFLAPFASGMRKAAGIPTAMSWAIDTPHDAQRVIDEGAVDMVMLARPSLFDPNWPLRAAVALERPDPAKLLPIRHGHWLQSWLDGGRILR